MPATTREAELVITAPEPFASELRYATRCRSTEGILVELFAEATRRVVIASPYMQPSRIIETGPLSEAIRAALKRQVALEILTTRENIESKPLSTLARAYPGQVHFFLPVFPEFDVTQLGSHAKFCIRDGEAAYLGSANLTGPGLKGHFEMGVILFGRIASAMQDFWDFAVRYGLFEARIP